jgi:hypothetical protein
MIRACALPDACAFLATDPARSSFSGLTFSLGGRRKYRLLRFPVLLSDDIVFTGSAQMIAPEPKSSTNRAHGNRPY